MRILVVGLEAATPDHLFGDEHLENIRRLMEYGCYGTLKGIRVQTPYAAWRCMVTSQMPASLGEPGTETADDDPYGMTTFWNQVETHGKRAIVIGLPHGFSHPSEIVPLPLENIPRISSNASSTELNEAQHQAYQTSLGLFDLVNQLLKSEPWDYFQFVDHGLSQLYDLRASKDPEALGIQAYYRHLDGQIEKILEQLNDDTIVMILSARGAQDQQGCFILASANNPLQGEIKTADLLDIAPTLLELAGFGLPSTMQGRSLVSGLSLDGPTPSGLSAEEEEILRERLSGLGYLD